MTFKALDYIPSNLQSQELYVEIVDDVQFILGKGEVKLSTSYDNAIAEVTIDITDAGSGVHTIRNFLSNQSDTFTVDVSTDILSLESFLDLEVGAVVRLSTDGVLPAGLVTDTDYYVSVTPAFGRYIDIKNKYKDFLSLDNEIVNKIISEQGFDYISNILDLMTLANLNSKVFLGYIGIVHLLKGNRRGLELVFGLLGLNYTLTEWWEKAPQGIPDTFDLTVDIDMAVYTFEDVDSFDTGIQNFVSRYVYPIFDNYAINATLTNQSPFYIGATPLTGEEVKILPPITRTVTTQSATPYIAAATLLNEMITVDPV